MIPLNEQAYQHLSESHYNQQAFLSGNLFRNQIIKGTGYIPYSVRDAIHRLAQEGYIDIIPSKGFMLHQLSRKDVNETFQVRSALESYCTLQISKTFQSRNAKKLFKELDGLWKN